MEIAHFSIKCLTYWHKPLYGIVLCIRKLGVISLKLSRYLFIVLILIFCSPNQESTIDKTNKIDSTQLIESTGLKDENEWKKNSKETVIEREKDNSFREFFDRFKKDSVFQISRIDFPFNIISVDIEDKITIESTEKLEWKYLDLTYDSSYFYRDVDAYEIKIKTEKDSTTVHFQGIDNGIDFIYIFYNRSNNWFLNRLED